ncbi:MAG: phage baseplate assembly protein V [Caldilineaceae bacterium]
MQTNGTHFTPFDIPTPGHFAANYLAEVTSVKDAQKLGRVQVRLLNFDGVEDHDGPIWARVATPFAGGKRGAFFLPDVGDEVLVAFINGDSRFPVVVGGLWNGSAKPPEELGGDRVDRWTIVGKAGTRIAIVETSPSSATIKLSTPKGVTAELTDSNGGKVEIKLGGTTITATRSEVKIKTGGGVAVDANEVNVKAGMVNVKTAQADFSGIVKCKTLITEAVNSKAYSQGIGNLW